jgi:predicted DCC family thiol-disulfide oxidoreductase YuxK
VDVRPVHATDAGVKTVDPVEAILFFDGYCGLCNGFVDFLIARDVSSRIRFAPIQGATAAALIPEDAVSEEEGIAPRSIVLWHGGIALRKSDAVLRVVGELGGAWKVFRVLYGIPLAIRNFIYDRVAGNRYRWFGRRTSCRLPSEAERERFLP